VALCPVQNLSSNGAHASCWIVPGRTVSVQLPSTNPRSRAGELAADRLESSAAEAHAFSRADQVGRCLVRSTVEQDLSPVGRCRPPSYRGDVSYQRPLISEHTYVDEDGRPYRYGDRWGHAGPPEASYSHDSHPGRFAPLHDVARALVDHLVADYDVAVEGQDDRLIDLTGFRESDIVRVFRLEPAADSAAPLTIALSSYPGVVVLAGAAHEAWLPHCGCDACDETTTSAADDLEELVDDVVEGRFEEHVSARHSRVGFRRWSPGGSSSGGGSRPEIPRQRLDQASARLDALDGPWQPWPRRRVDAG